MSFVPQLNALPAGIAALADYEDPARALTDPATWAYLNAGAGDEITARANRAAWDRLGLLPRVLQPLAGASTAVELLGRKLPCPVLLAPVAYQQLAHPDGELASAHAAAAQGAGFVLSTQSSVALEAVAQAVRLESGRGPLWFQLYPQPDAGVTRDLVRRAELAGYEAIVLTVDAPVQGARDAQRRTGFRLPPAVRAANLQPYPAAPLDGSAGLLERVALAPTWSDVEALVDATRLPVILKGLLHPEDAREAVRVGAAAVIVSNHGGRNLDTTPATARMLPRVAQAVAGDIPVLVDGGIRRGTDVLKALALGARAVLVGRPLVWALAAAGALGVAHALRLLRDELESAMALSGCVNLQRVCGGLLLAD
jgi:4-hydroxymandelate oxidase